MNMQLILDALAEKIKAAKSPKEIREWTAAVSEALELLKSAGAQEVKIVPQPYPVHPDIVPRVPRPRFPGYPVPWDRDIIWLKHQIEMPGTQLHA